MAEVMKYFQAKNTSFITMATKIRALTNDNKLKPKIKSIIVKMKIVTSSVSYMMDLVKDSIMIVEISRSEGGFHFMINRPSINKTVQCLENIMCQVKIHMTEVFSLCFRYFSVSWDLFWYHLY